MPVRLLPSAAVLLVVPLVAACASAAGDATASATDAAPTMYTDTGTPPTEFGPEATGYALSGRLLVSAAKGDRADLEITTYGIDGAELCREPLAVALTPAAPPDDEPLLAWWSVSLDTQASLCGVEEDLFASIGIGAWDDRLQASLVQQGLDGATAFGLYLREADTTPVWVLGVAGTPSQLAGDDAADPLAPLADAAYDASFLVQAPWPAR
jgi:hypothetical protein